MGDRGFPRCLAACTGYTGGVSWLWRPLLLGAALAVVFASAAAGGRAPRIVFAAAGEGPGHGATQVFSIGVNGSDRVQLTHSVAPNLGPAFSQDGTRLAFERGYHGRANDLWTMNADGSDERTLTRNADGMDEANPTWSPDGTKIAFEVFDPISKQGIWIINGDGTGLRRLTDGGEDGSPSWSPDGNEIAFGRYSDIYVVSVSGRGLTKLTDASVGADGYEPRWSPDGSQIAFVADRPPQECSEPTDLWLMSADGSTVRQLTDTLNYAEEDPIWLPNGQIAFIRETYGGGGTLWTIDADGTNLRNITDPFTAAPTDEREATPAPHEGC